MTRRHARRPLPPRTATPHAAKRRRLPGLAVAIAVLVIALLAAAIFVVRRPAPAASPIAGRGPNVLLITLDTTRADHLGCYGYARARTRHLDQLAREGVRFEWAFSPAPITLPAHASILTGLYPFEHGVRNNGDFYLADRFETLATVLHKAGYRTAAFVSSFILDRRYGLARGFDVYDDRQEATGSQVVNLEAERRGDRTALVLSSWLDTYGRDRSSPFFAWLHLFDPHEPYAPPQPFRQAFADAPYDGEIAFDDAIVASVMDKLGQLSLRDETLVVIVGDHGESLGDHGEETHSMFVYDSAIRVPLIIWRPGIVPSGVVVHDAVRLTDVAPTVIDLVGAVRLPASNGRSLVPLIQGRRTAPVPVYSETLLPQLYMNWAPLKSVRDDRWKLIEAPRPELYDVQNDPAEHENRYEQQPQTTRVLQELLERLTGGVTGEMSHGRLDRETQDRLSALGYIGAGAGSRPGGGNTPARADPKDRIAVYNRLKRAHAAARERRFDEALPILREVLNEDQENAFAHQVLGGVYLGLGENAKAIEQYRKYLALVPPSAQVHHWIAICYLRLGGRDKALQEAAAALAVDSRFSDARILRGGVFASRGEYDPAIAELRAAVETDPSKPVIRLDLANVLAEAGRTDEARAQYEAILRLQPDYAPAAERLRVLNRAR
jgi:arylsulfatase A-like enzyme/Tfp pilus assembly protein PilF